MRPSGKADANGPHGVNKRFLGCNGHQVPFSSLPGATQVAMGLEIARGRAKKATAPRSMLGPPISSPLAMNTGKRLATSNVLISKAQHQERGTLIGHGIVPSS